jgi:glutamine amidotransferase
MSAPDVAIVDYGIGNLLSVRRGLEHCGARVVITSASKEILSASRVVLPGVGAFADGMAELRSRGLDSVVKDAAARGIPLLGICLGMQMLLEESEEFGLNEGLRLIPGRVVPIPSRTIGGEPMKIPHIGWSGLMLPATRASWAGTMLQEVRPGESVYLVHSFMAKLVNPSHGIANCIYGGVEVPTAIGRDNVFGCQFHPEKSGEVGLRILRSFVMQ